MNEPLLNLALALHSNPGVYALLLGSGVSRGAGIPTGWDIVLDLISRVAAADGHEPPADPAAWYEERFGEAPDYAKLLDRLTKTPAERMGLLRRYFEPTADEAEQGLKAPTDAHRAIAQLVKLGCVRMILTTNFDRLIETALTEEGITPDVLSSDDDIEGAVPYVHSGCVVLKLNGDYLDTRIKNTPDELANYPKRLKDLLDRILDEYGLVVCGWSAEWDTALAAAIRRCRSRRFGSYWLARGDLKDQADRLVRRRAADVVTVEGADSAFAGLLEKIESLQELDRPRPISTAVAVSTVKRYLAEPRFRIPLREMFHDETEEVQKKLTSGAFPVEGEDADATNEAVWTRTRQYEAVAERLVAMVVPLSYYGEREHGELLTRAVERLGEFPLEGGLNVYLALRRYPALMAAYAGGVAALGGKRYTNLAAILRRPELREQPRQEKIPAVTCLNAPGVLHNGGQWIPRPREREFTPASNHLSEMLRPVLKAYLPGDDQYEDTFDTFEYLLALTYLDLSGEEPGQSQWSPLGRFGWRWRDERERAPWAEFMRAGLAEGEEWGLLKAGFFGGSVERASALVETHAAWLREATARWR